MNTQEKLQHLADMWDKRSAVQLHYDDQRRALIPPEIQAELDKLDAEKDEILGSLAVYVDTLVAEIKADVIEAGATVKTDRVQAVWMKGRVSWDTKALDGYAAAHPELSQFRKEGAPSVSLKWKD